MIKACRVVWIEASLTDRGCLGQDGTIYFCTVHKTRQKHTLLVAENVRGTCLASMRKRKMHTLVYAGTRHGSACCFTQRIFTPTSCESVVPVIIIVVLVPATTWHHSYQFVDALVPAINCSKWLLRHVLGTCLFSSFSLIHV